ncbi:MAG: glycosyltransferase [Flavobacteriales bacterium]
MTLVFVTEARFTRGANGVIYGESSFNNSLWPKYLRSFSSVKVLARVIEDPDYSDSEKLISSMKNVSFIEVPYYIGPKQFLEKRLAIKRLLKQIIKQNLNCVFICRIPGLLGDICISILRKEKKEYGVEVVGDPWDVFSKNSINHILSPFFKYFYFYKLRQNVIHANAVLYVTERTLQERYPAKPGVFVTYASNVELFESDFSVHPKQYSSFNVPTIISVGSLEQMYKSPDIVLKALRILKDKKIEFRFIWLGGGRYMNEMITLSKDLQIDDCVQFLGNVSMVSVRQKMTEADIFVLASRTEGLPRVIVEAQAKGLPCIGSNIGGIPELLSKRALVEPENIQDLVGKIETFLLNKELYNSEAKVNLNNSKNYSHKLLTKRREKFFESLIQIDKNKK